MILLALFLVLNSLNGLNVSKNPQLTKENVLKKKEKY
jgi:hypothetical protein